MRTIALILLAAAPHFEEARAQTVRTANGQLAARPPAQPSAFDCAAGGTVVNSVTGEPVVRARVIVSVGEYGYSAGTDSSGTWALNNMACGPANLQVSRNGFLVRRMPVAISSAINLTSGSPVHGIRTELVPQSVAYGKVVDDQGDPVQNVQVVALVLRVVDGRPRMQPGGLQTTTNDLGEYRISGLARGRYIFCAHANQPNGLVAQQGTQTVAADACYPGPPDGGGAGAMELPAGREAKIDFTLSEVPAAHVRGTVTGWPEGRSGSGVRMERRAEGFGSVVPGTVRDGKFDFRVPPGSYTLAADYFEGGTRLTARVPVDVGTSDIDNIVVHVEPAFSVKGVVHAVSDSGRALPQQFGITLRSSDPTVSGGQMKWEADHINFAINEMTPGNYRLEASPPAPFYVKSATLAGQDILNNELPIAQAAGPIEIQLRDDGGSLETEVTDANGQPVQTSILLLRGSIRVAMMNAPTGRVKFPTLAPGDYTVCAWDDATNVQYAEPDWMRRYGGGCQTVTVTAGQDQQIRLVQQTTPE